MVAWVGLLNGADKINSVPSTQSSRSQDSSGQKKRPHDDGEISVCVPGALRRLLVRPRATRTSSPLLNTRRAAIAAALCTGVCYFTPISSLRHLLTTHGSSADRAPCVRRNTYECMKHLNAHAVCGYIQYILRSTPYHRTLSGAESAWRQWRRGGSKEPTQWWLWRRHGI